MTDRFSLAGQGEDAITSREDVVVVVGTAAAETWLLRALAEHDAMRGGVGLPALTVVDLRPQ